MDVMNEMNDILGKKRNIIEIIDDNMDEVDKKVKKRAKRCIHNKRLFYCKECDGRRLCIHEKCKYTCVTCKGPHVCKHDKNKYTCKLCEREKMFDFEFSMDFFMSNLDSKQDVTDIVDNEPNNTTTINDVTNTEQTEQIKQIKQIEKDNFSSDFDFVFNSGYYKLEILREKNRHSEYMKSREIELKRIELELLKIKYNKL